MYSAYYAPRGRQRLYLLAGELSARYLYPTDLLIGIIGSEGSGKSTLIKGLFPGLELTNDDVGVNIRPTPLYDFDPNDFFAPHTFHIDARYELAFHQKFDICEAISTIIRHGRRVVVEHFDLIQDAVGFNAHILFGIGEEVIVARPGIFGPWPSEIKKVVDKTIRYRLMAHSAEDITSYILAEEYNTTRKMLHSDVKHGFVIKFPQEPGIDLDELEAKVLDVIKKDLPIGPAGDDELGIGEWRMYCTGTRTHVKSTGMIENFHLKKEFIYDALSREYLLVGIVGNREIVGLEDMAYLQET
ncbi:alanine-tRNA synthetase second additional domain-containing protein [Myxococcota bacterium]|nr:alanine-tRNA synthetase second additional domain-containing protein [Myxococcota bacterium]MBU1535058.1 alanine-tRNA synthetase second additional domain-containing protein [Myxococcota bacterium]